MKTYKVQWEIDVEAETPAAAALAAIDMMPQSSMDDATVFNVKAHRETEEVVVDLQLLMQVAWVRAAELYGEGHTGPEVLDNLIAEAIYGKEGSTDD